MISREFTFHSPTTLDEALALMEDQAVEATVLAGGMSLLPMMNLGLSQPSCVISLSRIPELTYVEDDGDHVRIGAMTLHKRVAGDPLVRQHCPPLAEAAAVIGDVQIRNRGTIGGSVAHADPAADYLPPLVALGATVKLRRTGGEREVPVGEFAVGTMTTTREPTELLTELTVPKLAAGGSSSFLRLARVEGAFAIVNVAAVASGSEATIAIAGATSAPVSVTVDIGNGGIGMLDEAGDLAYGACAGAIEDPSGTGEYRREMARVYARRALARALAAGGGRP